MTDNKLTIKLPQIETNLPPIKKSLLDKYKEIRLGTDSREFSDFLRREINDNNDDRHDIVDTALERGFNPNKLFRGECNLLHISAELGDMILVEKLVKHGADIYKKDYRKRTVLHICATNNYKEMLKFFLTQYKKKNLSIDDFDKQHFTAIMVACHYSQVESVKLFIDFGAAETRDDDRSAYGATIHQISNNGVIRCTCPCAKERSLAMTGYHVILESLLAYVGKKVILSDGNFYYYKCLIERDHTESIKLIATKYPPIVNYIENKYGYSLLYWAATQNRRDLVELFLTFKEIKLHQKNRDGSSFIPYLAANCNINALNTVINLDFTLTDYLCKSKKNLIHYCLLPSFFYKKTDKEIIDTLQFLVSHAVDINMRDDCNVRPLEIAIQNCSVDVVNTVIDLGANISNDRIHHNAFPCIANNDPIGYAAFVGKLDIVKSLISDKKAKLHCCDFKNMHKVPTPVVLAIMNSHDDVLTYLLDQDYVKPYITETMKKILFNFAVEEGSIDEKILINFVSKKEINTLKKREKSVVADGFEKYIEKTICVSGHDKLFIIESFHYLTSIYNGIFILQEKPTETEIVKDIFGYTEDLYDSVSSNTKLIEKIISVICDKIGHPNTEDLKKCVATIMTMRNTEDISWRDDIIPTVMGLSKILTPEKIKKLESLSFMVSNLYFRYTEEEIFSKKKGGKKRSSVKNGVEKKDYDNVDRNSHNYNIPSNDLPIETGPKIKSDSDEKLSKVISVTKAPKVKMNKGFSPQKQVEKLLFKLSWPFKLEHYDEMFNNLTSANICFEKDNKLSASSNWKMHNIQSTIYPLNKSRPKTWFKYYSPHIGKAEKQDVVHMFPFSLDKKIVNYPCVHFSCLDPTDYKGSRMNNFYHFYGELVVDGNSVMGCYEYFINGSGNLFHRMFREMDKVTPKVLRLIPFELKPQ